MSGYFFVEIQEHLPMWSSNITLGGALFALKTDVPCPGQPPLNPLVLRHELDNL